jgi:hypothetical protein
VVARSRTIRGAAGVAAFLTLVACDPSQPTATTATTAPVPGTVQPVVLCTTGSEIGVVYFGYTNDGTAPVDLPVGPSNRIVAGDGTTALTTNQTGAFAPGTQPFAAWAAVDEFGPTATWSVTGADGVEHSASATIGDPAAPECGGDFPALDPPDDRTATLAGTADVAADGTVTATIALTGLAADSRCPSGPAAWTPDPPEVVVATLGFSNATIGDQSDPTVARVTINDPHSPTSATVHAEGFASVRVAVDVTDHCHDAAGHVSSAWAASESVASLSQFDRNICFGVVDEGGQAGYGEVDCSLGPILALTGGIRVR